jgi:hypothetical protein
MYLFVTILYYSRGNCTDMLKRWGIELLFKKMKQNFQLHHFYRENENAIQNIKFKTMIAQLFLT